jgi:hypothetical protein
LGGITLPNDLDWVDEFHWTGVEQEVRRTLGGTPVFRDTVLRGRPITVQSRADFSHFTAQQVSDIGAMAGAPGVVYTLVRGSDSFRVRFHHAAAPAIQFDWEFPFTGYYQGTMKLITTK